MVAQNPTIASGALKKLLESLPDLGVEPAVVCTRTGFDPAVCEDRDARVPITTLHALWEAALERMKRPDAALVVAQHYSPGDYALVGFVCMNCKTLIEGFHHVERYLRLWTDEPGISFEDSGAVNLVYRGDLDERPGKDMATEATFAELLHSARLLTQEPFAPREVLFAHAGPEDTSKHEEFFGAPVRFSQPRNVMQLRKEDLHIELPRADAQLGDYLRNLANEALKRRGDPASFIERMRSLIAEELQKGVPDLDKVATRMAMGERTLRRRLEEEGTNYRTLLDETRAELARNYVRDRRHALSEVAFMLGFSEQSAFHRAFKRWTNTTPAAWRQLA